MERVNKKLPTWFKVIAIIALLWNIMGVLSFFMHVFMPDEAIAALPEKEQALYGEYPLWTNIVFALATIAGLLGAIGLVMKKKWSKPFFILSLLAVIPQMIHNVFFTTSIEVYGIAQAVTMPVLVVVFAVVFVWFSAFASKKAWLS